MKNRYPGAKPFSGQQQNIFFGREEDITQLNRMIELEQLVVLYGKSGLGKSSLINAGIIPELQKKGEVEPLLIRLGAWTADKKESPLSITTRFLRERYSGTTALDKVIPQEDSLWYQAKSRQLLGGNKPIVLFFDQFEELFSYPEAQIKQFKAQMAELLRSRLPQRYEQMLEVMANQDNELLSEAEETAILEPIPIKTVFTIRSDRMHLLDRLSDFLPAILRNNYELQALSSAAARKAILLPASASGDFGTPAFTYSEPATDHILDFLKDESDRVEGIQLQILCQSFEEKVLKEGLQQLTAQNIGNLEETIANYYRNKIESLGTAEEQLAARRLIEEGLVLEEEEQRLTLHEGQIAALFGVTPTLLGKLVDSHLLRIEPASRGGYTYELSHDTLVGPVLAAKEARMAEERREAAARLLKEQQQQLIEARKKQRRAWLFATFAALLALLAIAAFFAALHQQKAADQAKKEATDAKEAAIENEKGAVKARDRAIAAENAAKASRDSVVEALALADFEKKRANNQALNAEKARTLAVQAEANAKVSRDSAILAFQFASQQKERADSEAQKAKAALENFQKASGRIVDNLLADAQRDILALEYSSAMEKMYDAKDLQVKEKANSVTMALMELVFYFSETYNYTQAKNVLGEIQSLVNYQYGNPFAQQDTLEGFRQILKKINKNRFDALNQKYYPEMVTVAGGTFEMGCKTGRDGDCDDDETIFEVTLDSFKIAKTETTVWQYHLYTKATGRKLPAVPSWGWKGNNPIVRVSWYHAIIYAHWLNEQLNYPKALLLDSIPKDPYELHGKVNWQDKMNWEKASFRLPTEAEWEYAARGGKLSNGYKYAGSNEIDTVAWYNKNSNSRTHEVALKQPNELGLYDMSGNAWEWCWDWGGTYPTEPSENPKGPDSGYRRVLRGGSWFINNYYCRVANRFNYYPLNGDIIDGFRMTQGLPFAR